MASEALLAWLRAACADYRMEPIALFRRSDSHAWPLAADDNDALEVKLRAGGHFLPLPREPAALANILVRHPQQEDALRLAAELVALLHSGATERFLGFPEALAVRLNGLAPALLDPAFARHRRSLPAAPAAPAACSQPDFSAASAARSSLPQS